MKKLWSIYFCFFVSVLLAGNLQAGTIILDQHNIQLNGGVAASTGYQYAQTFTVGQNGILSSAEINFFWHPTDSSSDTILLEIFPTINGIPILDSSQTLARVDLTRGDLPLFQNNYSELITPPYFGVDLSMFDIHVQQGDVYAIAIDAPNGGGLDFLATFGQDTYLSGSAFYRENRSIDREWVINAFPSGDFDHNFRTFVDTSAVPIPGSIWMFCAGIIGVFGLRKKKISI